MVFKNKKGKPEPIQQIIAKMIHKHRYRRSWRAIMLTNKNKLHY
jgi:hypothetical protein